MAEQEKEAGLTLLPAREVGIRRYLTQETRGTVHLLAVVTNQVIHDSREPVLVVHAGDLKVPPERSTGSSVSFADVQEQDSSPEGALVP